MELQAGSNEALYQIMVARYYSSSLGRFMAVDPASESINPANPQTWNRYSYVLNNPLILIDPTGETLTVSGSDSAKKKAQDTANSGLHGKEAKVDSNGNVTLADNGVQGPPSPEQAAFEGTLSTAIGNSANTSISLSEGSSATIVGEYGTGDVDMNDVQALGSGPGASAVGALGHEVAEQFARQVLGQPRGTETSGAHGAGIAAENGITGSVRGPQTQSLRQNRDGTISGTVGVPYTRGGSTTTSTLHIDRGNVVNVTRTP